jgi:hypothetical protein
MDIIIGTRGQPQKFNMPHCSQDESDDDQAPRKSGAGAPPAKKFENR